jgi:hypothetical protein
MIAYEEDPTPVPQNPDSDQPRKTTDPDWKPGRPGEPVQPPGGQEQGERTGEQPGGWTGNQRGQQAGGRSAPSDAVRAPKAGAAGNEPEPREGGAASDDE